MLGSIAKNGSEENGVECRNVVQNDKWCAEKGYVLVSKMGLKVTRGLQPSLKWPKEAFPAIS